MSCNDQKWVRRDLIAIWDGQPYTSGKSEEREENMAECDRILIALHRFQTIGKVSYRRLVGMHGGGGGTSSEEFRKILSDKVQKDIKDHYPDGFPDDGKWPNPVPNAVPPRLVDEKDPDSCFMYTFCWHAEPQFLLWHRPLMAEFERGLQEHDPMYDHLEKGDPARHQGKDALGAPYWAWEGWDGLSLPQVVDNAQYVVKTDKWKKNGFPRGSVFNNPFHRWFAPVGIEEQKKEYFPDILSAQNSTTRSAAFHDFGTEFYWPWPQVSAPKNPSMEDNVYVALNNPDWNAFATMNPEVGSTWSIETPHNRFHNHLGDLVHGGLQGPGRQIDLLTKGPYTGTMAQNQSIFDPIFWLHHSNVERQLMSWQRRFAKGPADRVFDVSKPPENQMETVLYPWTKPECLFQGEMSWNTPSSKAKDGTFADWWEFENLPYAYERYLEPPTEENKVYPFDIIPMPPTPYSHEDAIRMIVSIDADEYQMGEYALFFNDELVGVVSVLSGRGSVCARCASRREGKLGFEVSDTFATIQEAKKAYKNNELSLTRDGEKLQITNVVVRKW